MISCDAFSPGGRCRPWYKSAVANPQGPVFNSVLRDAANPGSLFISLSRSLWGAAGELVGVVALDMSLKQLTEALIGNETHPKRLYQSGYAFVWDANNKGVIHKNYAAEHSDTGSAPDGSAVEIARLDSCGGSADCSGGEIFIEQFQQGILDKGRVKGNFSYVWFGQTWHYSFLPIKGTTYMMALTVEQTEVTKVPDDMVARCQGRVSILVVISTLAFVLALVVLYCSMRYFDRRFAAPVRRLEWMVSWNMKNDYKESIPPEMREDAASMELRAIIDNLRSLWVALRFGNAKYHGNDKDKEAANYAEALKLVEKTGNKRGLGICHNNLANIAAQNEKVRANGFSPELHFEAAIANAREIGPPATLATRLFYGALWHMREGRIERASAMLGEVASCGADGNTLAALAAAGTLSISTSNLEAKDKELLLTQQMKNICERAVATANSAAAPLEAEALAQLCVAVADLGGPEACWAPDAAGGKTCWAPEEWAAWALQHVPSAKLQTLSRLVLHCKAGASSSVQQQYDAMAKASLNPKWKGGIVNAGGALTAFAPPSAPKVMLFVLDLSYSMDSDSPSRLTTCKASLTSILAGDCLKADDRAGLVTFADDVRIDLDLTLAGPEGGLQRKNMLNKVASMRTRGMTAFYSAVHVGAKISPKG